jgi:hypothetical protein
MLETAMDSSKHMVSRVFLCLRLVSLGLLLGVVLASTAAAAGTETAPPPNQTEAGQESQQGQAQGEGTPATPGETETPPVTETPPIVEVPAEVPPVVEVPVEIPPVVEVPVEVPPIMPIVEERQESGTGAAASEEGSKGSSPLSPIGTVDLTDSASAESTEGQVLVLGTTSTTPPTAAGAIQEAAPAELGEATVHDTTHKTAAQQAGRLSCELSTLSGPLTQNCAAGWLGTPMLNSQAATSSSGAPTLGVPPSSSGPGGGGGAGALGNRPATPAPGGSTSNGTAGGAAGGAGAGGVGGSGGGGLGLSAFLTIAGLLLLAAPHAMRRLRLSCLPWRTAFFVLIPERPG